MRITHLGHAGFLVESDRALVVMDPWLSATGGIDSSWFQYPRNHHLADTVRERLRDESLERYVYVSHEHKDHFDPEFLRTLEPGEFRYVVPRYRRTALRDTLADFPSRGVVALADGEPFEVSGGYLKIFLADGELNRDSAILARLDGRSFLNVNDCKIHDRMSAIAAADGPIDVFTAQFSGATFHPTCYDYPRDRYEEIARRKIAGKFKTVAHAIEETGARVYIPSAGPPCFLDPDYLERNFQPVSIFHRPWSFFRYLDAKLGDDGAARLEMMPGDVLDAVRGEIVERSDRRVDDADFESYVRAYAADYDDYFAERKRRAAAADADAAFAGLRDELRAKLKALTLRDRVATPLYFELAELPGRILLVDFTGNSVEEVNALAEGDHYRFVAQASDIEKLLSGALTWEDYMGTFRPQLSRTPDVYNTILTAFLLVEKEDLGAFCEKHLAIAARGERIVVEAGGRRYEVDRFCPHLGGDLCRGWVEGDRFLVCPRHHWRYDLANGGASVGNNATVNATPVDEA